MRKYTTRIADTCHFCLRYNRQRIAC